MPYIRPLNLFPLIRKRFQENLNNATPSDVYFGRDKSDISERKKIKRNTINHRCLQHFRKVFAIKRQTNQSLH